ncbi:MAG TPA: VWA domain-containing protein [Pyrinomonadaceae bacterium]
MHANRLTLIAALTLTFFTVSFAQSSSSPKRKKIKDFGSSLKRLKWNPEKNAVEVNAPGTELDEGDVIRIDTSLVTSELMVLDERGNPVSGLTAEDFSVSEDGAPQTVGHFLKGDNANVPRTIVLIIDYSGSQLPFIKNSVNAAKLLVDKLGPKDLMAIVTDDVELIVDFTADKKQLKKKLDSLLEKTRMDTGVFPSIFGPRMRLGRSWQYSALMATLNEAFNKEEDVRPIIIFQTDGDEAYSLKNSIMDLTVPYGLEGEARAQAEASIAFQQRARLKDGPQFSLDDLYRAVEKSRVTLYTVVPGIKLTGLTTEERYEKYDAHIRTRFKDRYREDYDSRILRRWYAERTAKLQHALSGVAPLTGGWTEFLETPDQADAIYSRIFSDINQRYIIGYYPTNKERDGKRRKIDFAVKGHPEYQVYGRRSYFAPSF